jgi:hypothetical protein
MSSKLLNAALAALLLGSTGLLADNTWHGTRHGDGDHRGWQQRGWNGGAPHRNVHPPQRYYHPPYRHDGWHGHGWKHGHYRPYRHGPYHRYHGYRGHYPRRYADNGDDITIIFRGSLD